MHPSIDSRKTSAVNPILESITDAFYSLGEDWAFGYVNGVAEKLLQRTREDLIGKCIWDEYPDLLRTPVEDLYQRAARA